MSVVIDNKLYDELIACIEAIKARVSIQEPEDDESIPDKNVEPPEFDTLTNYGTEGGVPNIPNPPLCPPLREEPLV